MKKLLFTVILCLTTSIICMGQDVHLQQLTQGVISLRKAASKARNTLVADWSREQMPKITLMDDIGRVPSEARGKGCNPFMLNQVVTYVYSRQNTSMSSKGDYFNSTEKDIYYSAIEKTVKPHQTATYTLSGHIGHQQFMFITFNPKYYILGLKSSAQENNKNLPQTVGWEVSSGGSFGTFDPLSDVASE